MNVAVFGLGYVGCVSAACLADLGHQVVGVDVNETKVDLINGGKATVVEEGIAALVKRVVSQGLLEATTDAAAAVASTDVALVCVGTPSTRNGGLATDQLDRVADQLAAPIAERAAHYTVAIRSSVLPGTCEERIVPRLEATGSRAGHDFSVVANPEFLREGSSIADFREPSRTVIGELTPGSGDAVVRLYESLPGHVFRVPLRVAEMIKYVDNAFHAVKISFANEIGAVCKTYGLDSNDVMEIFTADTKLNISASYLRPGFAFGGSCLPKDMRALVRFARAADVDVPLLEHVLPSNAEHLTRVYDRVLESGRRNVGLFGLSFKAGTDDLRESPMVELAERLLGRGFDLRIRDPNVSVSRLTGVNREFIDARIPHLAEAMLPEAKAVLDHADVCIVAATDPDVEDALRTASGKLVIDLVRLRDRAALAERNEYWGVAW